LLLSGSGAGTWYDEDEGEGSDSDDWFVGLDGTNFRWYYNGNQMSLSNAGDLTVTGETTSSGTIRADDTVTALEVDGDIVFTGADDIMYSLTDTVSVFDNFFVRDALTVEDGDATYGLSSTPTVTLGVSDTSSAGTLRLYGNTAGDYSTIQSTTSNLHIDSDSAGKTFLNHYSGTNVVIGTSTTGLEITSAGVINDVNGAIELNDAVSISGTVDLNDNHLNFVREIEMQDWDDDGGGGDDNVRLLARDDNWMFYNGGVVIGQYGNGAIGDIGDGNLRASGNVRSASVSTNTISDPDDTVLTINDNALVNGYIDFNDGGTNIQMNNGDITEINQLYVGDPGEGLQFQGGTSGTVGFYVVDDATDNIVTLAGSSSNTLELDLSNSGSGVFDLSLDGDLTVSGNNVYTTNVNDYCKFGVWNSALYCIGMNSAMTYGALNDYAMTFTMNPDSDRGFVWRDSDDAKSDGAMSLTTGGILTVKDSVVVDSAATNLYGGASGGSYHMDLSSIRTVTTDSVPAGSNVYGIDFSPDGTKMYYISDSANLIYEYDLTTPWDVSTATSGASISSVETIPQALTISSDGRYMYVSGNAQSHKRWTMSTPWDISTASYDGSTTLSDTFVLLGIYINPTGTKYYSADYNVDTLREYSLSTPYDLSTATQTATLSVSDSQIAGMSFSPDGLRLYISAESADDIDEYVLSTPWDISTADFYQSVNVAAGLRGLYVKQDGSGLYMVSSSTIYTYATTTSFTDVRAQGKAYLTGLPTVGENDNVCMIASSGELVQVASSTCSTSSLRYKQNIHGFDSRATDLLLALEPVKYQRKSRVDKISEQALAQLSGKDFIGSRTVEEYGLIAEEVVEVIPEVVGLNANGSPERVDYTNLIPILIKGFQEQQSDIDLLKKKNGIKNTPPGLASRGGLVNVTGNESLNVTNSSLNVTTVSLNETNVSATNETNSSTVTETPSVVTGFVTTSYTNETIVVDNVTYSLANMTRDELVGLVSVQHEKQNQLENRLTAIERMLSGDNQSVVVNLG
jgi:sugar lactone lactonase YvrE